MASRVKHIRNLWNEYNTKYFGSALTEPCIRLTRASKYYGYFCVTCTAGAPTLRLSGKLNDTPQLLQDTLLHEMVHQYLWETGFPDWDSHGEAFKNEAGRVGVSLDGC